MKILTVLGTRPEIIKLSALIHLLDKEFEHIVVHTGQHYSYEMDKIFFEELDLNYPKYNLKVGSLSDAKQISGIWIGLEEIILKEKPDLVIVYGDTNSTLGGALTASKLHIPLMHIEAGCRSFNRNMPEEINRIIVDHISNYLLTPAEEGLNNLLKEGISKEKIFLIGSVLVDVCFRVKELSKNSKILEKLGLFEYILATMHRAENTNDIARLKGLINALNKLAEKINVVLSCHPRTKEVIKKNNILASNNMKIIDSVGYVDFIGLLFNSKFVMSDSGGVQEEAAILDIPCLILREETEWIKYAKLGKNMIVGVNEKNIVDKALDLLNDEKKLRYMKNIKTELKKDVYKKKITIINKIKKTIKNELCKNPSNSRSI